MQRQPEADRRRPGPAQDPALPAHGQGQDVGRRGSCCKEGGVEGAQEYCTVRRISHDRWIRG